MSEVAVERFLMPEDARFITSLYNLNMPAVEIATITESLRVERQRESASGVDHDPDSSSAGVVCTEPEVASPDGAPPEYDFKVRRPHCSNSSNVRYFNDLALDSIISITVTSERTGVTRRENHNL